MLMCQIGFFQRFLFSGEISWCENPSNVSVSPSRSLFSFSFLRWKWHELSSHQTKWQVCCHIFTLINCWRPQWLCFWQSCCQLRWPSPCKQWSELCWVSAQVPAEPHGSPGRRSELTLRLVHLFSCTLFLTCFCTAFIIPLTGSVSVRLTVKGDS